MHMNLWAVSLTNLNPISKGITKLMTSIKYLGAKPSHNSHVTAVRTKFKGIKAFFSYPWKLKTWNNCEIVSKNSYNQKELMIISASHATRSKKSRRKPSWVACLTSLSLTCKELFSIWKTSKKPKLIPLFLSPTKSTFLNTFTTKT